MKDPALVTIKGVTVQLKNAEVLAAIIRTKGKKQIDLAKETGASEKTINAIIKRCREAGLLVDESTRNVPVIGTSEYDGTEYRWDSVSATEKDNFYPPLVSECLQGRRENYAGFTWRHATEQRS